MRENGSRFSLSMHLEQTGDALSGNMQEFSADDANQFVLLKITGKRWGDSLQLFDLSVISESSPKNILWCRKIRRGIFIDNNDGMQIKGSWENDGDYVFHKKRLRVNDGEPCMPGTFMLYKKKPVEPVVVIPEPDSTFLPPLDNRSPEQKILADAAVRKDVMKQHIEVLSDSLRLQFYDNGEIDGDTISVIYNGKVLLSHRGLTARPLEIMIPVPSGSENKLQMFADNLGTIPPNTAILIFYDGRKKYVVYLDADGGRNAVVGIGKKIKN